MDGLKRQRSWHEDFSRNFLKLFSKNKSQEQDKAEPECDNREELEDDGALSQSSEADSPLTPKHHLNTRSLPQTLEHSEPVWTLEEDGVCDHEDSVQGDVESDPPNITPPVTEPCSPLPPVDGFFRRLGSLFLFTRAQTGEEDTQHTVKKDAEPGAEKEHTQPLKPQVVSHCTADPEVEAEIQTEQDIQDNLIREEALAEEDENAALESLSAVVEEENEQKEQERHRALACPPVVTHVTYRGLRKIRKMRRNQEVRLHSPISEGEEGRCEVDLCPTSLEEAETEQNETNGHAVTTPTEIHTGQPKPKKSLYLNNTSSDYQCSAPVDSSTINSNTLSKTETEGMHSALNSSALQTYTKAKINSLDFDPTVTSKMFCADENGACRSTVLEAVIVGEPHTHKLEPSESDSVPLTMESDFETRLHSQSLHTDDRMFPLLAKTPNTPQLQLSNTDTATNLNTHSAEFNTASDVHTDLISLKHAPDSCPDRQLSSSGLDGWDHEVTEAPGLSATADISGHAAWQTEFILEDEDTQLLGVDGKMLQLESKKIVDNILTNALAALERIDISERESETDKFMENTENLIFMGAKENMDADASLGQALMEHLPTKDDGNPQSTIPDGTLGSRVQADGSRSTPSSGYESIAGSDTDIRNSVAISADITSTSGLFSMQELREEAVSGCCPDELELCIERNSTSQSNRLDSLHHNTLAPELKLEVKEGLPRTETNNEQLPQYILSDSNITSVQLVTSETLYDVKNGQGQCALGECVSFSQENNDTGLQYSAKDNLESNNHGHALQLNSGDVSTINNAMESSQVEAISKSLCQVGVSNPDPEQFAEKNVFSLQDSSEKNKDRPNLSPFQSYAFDKHIEPHVVSCDSFNKPILVSQDTQSGDTQEPTICAGTGESSLDPDLGLSANVVGHGPQSEFQEEEKVSAGPSGIWLLNSELSADSGDGSECFRAVKVTVNDDQIQEHDTLKSDPSTGLSRDKTASRLAIFPGSARPHLDLPGTFAIISEEEEADTVFVNDTGRLLSPNTRRVKIYPFSLSPIYEEDSGREVISRDDLLHVPPATEEEQRSEEQQASSILSLLQSVSEKLQSSTFSSSETEQDMVDKPDEPECPQRFLRPLWERYDEDDDDDEAAIGGESSLLLHQQLTGTNFLSTEPQKNESSPNSLSSQQKTSETEDGDLGGKHCETAQSSSARSVNTPFYQYLKSNVVSSLATETRESKTSPNDESLTSTAGIEFGGFGKVSLRPTLLHIYEGLSPCGKKIEICGDVEDADGILFPQEATIQAQRGCWLLYVERRYQGSCILLEEGQTIQSSGETREIVKPPAPAPLSVGSFRRAVKDDTFPEIHINISSSMKKEPVCLHSEADNIGTNVHLSDLSVSSGCWVAYDGAGFTGNLTVLEAGGLTTPVLQYSPISCVRSLRPLRMGGLRVRRPLDPKMVMYEKPLFQGQSKELLENTPSLETAEGVLHVSSLRVTGGVWVGYSSENYRGQQCLLEEGEYSDCSTLFSGPGNVLRSCRFLQADFIEPAVSLNNCGEQVELVDQDAADLQQSGPVNDANTIYVKSGVWVAYSGKYFTGEQCVLEKGCYSGSLDWGGMKSSPISIRPVRRELCGERDPKFMLCAYSKPCFAGESREFDNAVADCGMLNPMSFRLIQGRWLLYDERGFCGNQFVLEEGLYPDLTSFGCMATGIKSFKPIQYSFSEPSISLFSLSSFEGLETVTDLPMETMSNFFTQSLRVNSGLWVLYEFSQFKGRQLLLEPGEIQCWCDYSGWDTIGSLHPLRQRRVYVRVQNRALGMALTLESTGGRPCPARISLHPAEHSLHTQHWMYTQSQLKSKVGKGCMSVIGGKACVGARVALWEEHGRLNQRWSLNENGTISSHLNPSLVLDQRGGSGIDKDHLILNEFSPDRATQFWDIEVL
ncbi:very large A-kinase anchor protein [Silurus asotus]|uniref:Very large A-kinase anchor protein n=1 Tax=Silurus asotus TaxID=30991 RepID=A0AAD5B8P2_SILAS|nr:very large A-kinase anchor protein [Silurus asotus]